MSVLEKRVSHTYIFYFVSYRHRLFPFSHPLLASRIFLAPPWLPISSAPMLDSSLRFSFLSSPVSHSSLSLAILFLPRPRIDPCSTPIDPALSTPDTFSLSAGCCTFAVHPQHILSLLLEYWLPYLHRQFICTPSFSFFHLFYHLRHFL